MSLDRIVPGQALQCEDGYRHGGSQRDEGRHHGDPPEREEEAPLPVDSVELSRRRRRRRRHPALVAPGKRARWLASAAAAWWLVYVLPEE